MAALFVAAVQRSTGPSSQPAGVPIQKSQAGKAFFLRLSASLMAKLERLVHLGASVSQPIGRLNAVTPPNHTQTSLDACRVLVGRRFALAAESVDANS